MGGGDLNLKKSWHPKKLKNQEQVWLNEQKLVAERKRRAQLEKELAEERATQELRKLQAAVRGETYEERMDWMYNTPAAAAGPDPRDNADFLLGRRKPDRPAAEEKAPAPVRNPHDTMAKVRDDPLFLVKQRELAKYEKKLRARKQRLSERI